jgi:20S proteasome alpha/beta subunit
MTIGLGFVSRSGVVLAADRQHTVQGVYKYERKLRLCAYPSCAVGSTFANLPNLANILNDRVHAHIQRFKKARSEALVGVIRDETRKLFSEYPIEMAQQEFLWAIGTTDEAARLVRVAGGIVDEPHSACIGVGDSSLVRYLMTQTSRIPFVYWTLAEVVRFAIYVTKQAKGFVDGVGGQTDVLTITRKDEYDLLSGAVCEAFDSDFLELQDAFEMLYNIWTNSTIDNEDRLRLISNLEDFLKKNRCQK